MSLATDKPWAGVYSHAWVMGEELKAVNGPLQLKSLILSSHLPTYTQVRPVLLVVPFPEKRDYGSK